MVTSLTLYFVWLNHTSVTILVRKRFSLRPHRLKYSSHALIQTLVKHTWNPPCSDLLSFSVNILLTNLLLKLVSDASSRSVPYTPPLPLSSCTARLMPCPSPLISYFHFAFIHQSLPLYFLEILLLLSIQNIKPTFRNVLYLQKGFHLRTSYRYWFNLNMAQKIDK